MKNQCVVFVRRPQGAVTPACFALQDAAMPNLAQGDVLVRNIYVSCDPYMRGRMPAGAAQPFALDAVIPARAVGQIAQSRNRDYAQGDFVWGFLGWALYSLAPGGAGLRRIDPARGSLSNAISVRGMPGLTAHIGMVDIGQPKAGETVFVSAASGAVGQVAGQLARLNGCRVVGSAGSAAKITHITDTLGFDAAFNYKTVNDIGAALDQHCPDGIDIYFDNVGGKTLNAVLKRINPGEIGRAHV
jgi:NADPH-dependent curcumin reductase CurA